jgi:hypothetical protein
VLRGDRAHNGTLTKVIIYQLRSHPGGNRHIWSAMDSGTNRADVYKTGGHNVYGSAAAGGSINFGGGTRDFNAHLEIATFGTSGNIEIDGTSVATGSGTAALATHCLGASTGSGTRNGAVTIAFAGFYVGTLTPTEKADLLAWAQSHYGTH